MTRASAIAVVAGALGGALLIAALRQSFLGVLLGAMLSPLPLAMTAFGLGGAFLPVAVVGGSVTVAILSGSFASAIVYLVVDAAPAVLLSRIAIAAAKANPNAPASGEALARTVCGLAAFAVLIVVVGLLLLPTGAEGIEAAVRARLDEVVTAMPVDPAASAELMKARAQFVEAMAAVLGGTQSLHTNSFDEAIALPTDFSAKIARDTQIFIQKETDVTRATDPWAGSYFVEQRTQQLVEAAWALIQEVEQMGGMAKAIEEGLPKLRIEEAAARKQARIDSGEEKIIGVNIFQVSDSEAFEILEVDNTAVREAQIRRLQDIRQRRDEAAVQQALQAIRTLAASAPIPGDADNMERNLLALAVEAARLRATLGEISSAMEDAFGRYVATTRTISGVYAASMSHNEDFEQARALADEFAEAEGRRPRIMIAKLGQ
ncbi:MAG: methylmalonyl-CoA mutase family protein, partial [Proteobacteria bacterium]|nr:methylmalonyl-CoA mutase family protein [Pseudomonadota bacterium]